MKPLLPVFACLCLGAAVTVCSSTSAEKRDYLQDTAGINNYIQVKLEDTDCSSGCDIEYLPGSANPVCFKKNPVLTSSDIVHASSLFNNSGQGYYIALELNSTGRTKLYLITRENRGKRLGIYIEGEFITAPVIYSVISDGKAAIAGGFSKSEADEIALKLNGGKRD
jgi:preprotein translocase subunit SecD